MKMAAHRAPSPRFEQAAQRLDFKEARFNFRKKPKLRVRGLEETNRGVGLPAGNL
jgi:hypothetical protein